MCSGTLGIVGMNSSSTVQKPYSSSVGQLFHTKIPGPEFIKLFFILNSAEHEILNAH